jgi:D-arabinose 1-dehydrogenase-like Zn-dependent alcohol dehydrogenase
MDARTMALPKTRYGAKKSKGVTDLSKKQLDGLSCISCKQPTAMPCSAAGVQKAMTLVEYSKPYEVTEHPLPVPVGTEVLIRTTYAGVCHSELHMWEGKFNLGGGRDLPSDPSQLPCVLGHEFEGEVMAVGSGVPDGFLSNNYAVFPWIGCDQEDCIYCGDGWENLCNSRATQRFIDGKSMYGGYSSHILVPHYKYLIDYEGVLPEGTGCVYMCSGLTAYSALKKVGEPPRGGSDVLILGLGGLGFQGLQLAKLLLGEAPRVADIDEVKLEEAAQSGSIGYNSGDIAAAKEIKADTGGGVYAVIDFVGSEASYAFAQASIRRGGRVVICGLFGGDVTAGLPLGILSFPFTSTATMGSLVGSHSEALEMIELLKQNPGKFEVIPHQFRSIMDLNQTTDDLMNGRYVGRAILKHDWPEQKM